MEAAQNEVTPEDLWKGTKTVLLEMARETIASVKTYAAIREREKQKSRHKISRTEGRGTEIAQSG